MFKPKNLSTLAYSSAFSFWHYAAGPGDNVDEEGYFDRANLLKRSDLIAISQDTASGPRTRFYTVTKAEAGCVIVKPMGKEHLAHTREIVNKKGKNDDNKTTTIESPESPAGTHEQEAGASGAD